MPPPLLPAWPLARPAARPLARLLECITLWGALWGGALWAQAPAGRTLPAGYGGTETCQACHEDTVRDFAKNPHYSLDTGKRLDWKARACESCHGAAKEHAESADVSKIFSFKTADKRQVNEKCLTCHGGQETHRGRLFGAHNRNNLSCLDCHTVHQTHQERLLVAHVDALCASCHTDVRAQFNRPYRHRLPEKAISCVDCHNPHGEQPPASLQRVSANEPVCVKCHGDKRGPFPFEHAPVKLGACSSCHEAHGSANPRMLVRSQVSQLCLECHANNLTTLGGVPPAFHNLRTARFQNCTICHSKIHGSLVNREFLR